VLATTALPTMFEFTNCDNEDDDEDVCFRNVVNAVTQFSSKIFT
jgi:hypothetical protein